MSDHYVKTALTKEVKPNIQSLKDDLIARRDPTYFWPCGTQVYCGRQGSGKTISLVKHLLDIHEKYPASIIVSNLQLNYFEAVEFEIVDDEHRTAKQNLALSQAKLAKILETFDPVHQYLSYSDSSQLAVLLTNVNNGFKGVIYVIDEIHTYFNSLESKDMPMYVFTEISQQRKQRKLILGSSQLFMRMAKPLREQSDSLIVCNTFSGFFTRQLAYDGMSLEQDNKGALTGSLKRIGWFFHNRHLREAFDTYQKVQSSNIQFEQTIAISDGKQKRKVFGAVR